jgi:hypothetical protein
VHSGVLYVTLTDEPVSVATLVSRQCPIGGIWL